MEIVWCWFPTAIVEKDSVHPSHARTSASQDQQNKAECVVTVSHPRVGKRALRTAREDIVKMFVISVKRKKKKIYGLHASNDF